MEIATVKLNMLAIVDGLVIALSVAAGTCTELCAVWIAKRTLGRIGEAQSVNRILNGAICFAIAPYRLLQLHRAPQ
jgi:hypothetical protein